MARRAGFAHNGGMDSVLIHNKEMTPRDWAIDVAVAVVAFAFGAVQLMVSASLILPDETLRRMLGIEAVVPAISSFIALALTTFPLVARRKSPWLVFVFTLVVFVGLQNTFHGSTLAVFGPMVALFTIVVECSRVEMAIACVASALGFAAATYGGTSAALWFWAYVQNLVLMAASALGGLAVCAHRDSVRATEQRAEEAERTREEVAARRVEEERVRIAREVHDITAHSLSAVSIQTAAAERLIERDPAAAKEAVSLAHKTAKEALEEIRAMIGVLRTGDSSAETTPTEGTARLMDLADYLQEAGVTATLDVSGYDREATPAFIDIALFGIAREATTNIVRHAHARNASIVLESDGVKATLTVQDDGDGSLGAAKGAPSTGGHGIDGMKERAKLLGGTLGANPLPNGGFRVHASIPVGDAPSGFGTSRGEGESHERR